MDNENTTNFRQVKDWMTTAGQGVPEKFDEMDHDVRKLRRILLQEEAQEAVQALMDIASEEDYIRAYAKVAKELADVLVVTYGAFVAMGVDGDVAFRLVMDNNAKKLTSIVFREDGKVEVPAERKVALKEEIHQEMISLIKPKRQ